MLLAMLIASALVLGLFITWRTTQVVLVEHRQTAERLRLELEMKKDEADHRHYMEVEQMHRQDKALENDSGLTAEVIAMRTAEAEARKKAAEVELQQEYRRNRRY